jgi:hypothetical protein
MLGKHGDHCDCDTLHVDADADADANANANVTEYEHPVRTSTVTRRKMSITVITQFPSASTLVPARGVITSGSSWYHVTKVAVADGRKQMRNIADGFSNSKVLFCSSEPVALVPLPRPVLPLSVVSQSLTRWILLLIAGFTVHTVATDMFCPEVHESHGPAARLRGERHARCEQSHSLAYSRTCVYAARS